MKNIVKSPTFRIAYCGVISALGLVIMMLTSLISIGTYAFPCFAGILISFVVAEYGCKWGIGVFAVVAILSAFLSGDKEAVLYFIALFGYYPVLKNVIEKRLHKKWIQYILKFAVFNAAAVASFFIAIFVLSIPADEFNIFGVYVSLVFLAAGNIFFLLYDYAVTVFVFQYVTKLRIKLFK